MGLKIVPGESGYMNLTTPQRETIQHVERFGASLSLAGVALIFVAYALFKRLRTVPNTFIVFASIANVGATTACLIGYAGIIAGDDSGLCRVQAFLLEMFMQSDPWWSLAMAVNVYMVFFMAANPNSFREYIWVYCLICFGLPLLPAVICLFYAPNNVRIYGNATLWCWIGDTYNQLRIFLYYLPIWMCIVLSAVIYVAVGYHVFHQRNQLRNLTLSNQAKDLPGTDAGGSAEKVSPAKMPFPPSPSVLSSRRRDQSWAAATTSTSTSHDPTSLVSYLTPSQNMPHAAPADTPPTPLQSLAGQPGCYGTVTTEVQVTAESSDNQTPPSTPTPSIAPVLQSVHPTAPLHDWTSRYDDIESCSPMSPISTNPFMTISSISSSHVRERRKGKKQRFRVWHKFVGKLHNLDPIKLAYLRTSFVFAISVLVTWTPSSINRVFSIAHPSATSFKLNLASAVVLPLQGVWNAVIFCATSWAVLTEEIGDLKDRWWPGRRSQRLGSGVSGFRDRGPQCHSGGQEMTSPTSPRVGTVRVIRGGSL